MVDQNERRPVDKLFEPILRAILTACAARLPPGTKPPLTHRPLVYLAWLAFAVSLGLGHLVTPELHVAASRAARKPGRKGKTPEGQASLLDLVPTTSDGLPGVYVSDVRLHVGNVRETCGSYILDLFGCHTHSTAVAKATLLGWGVIPELRGLRFLPPTICAMFRSPNIILGQTLTTDTLDKDGFPPNASPAVREFCDLGGGATTFNTIAEGPADFGPDSFGGSDEGSHYMSQERIEPPGDMLTPSEAKAVIEQSSHSYEPTDEFLKLANDKMRGEEVKSFRAKSNAQLVKNEEPDARPPKRETMIRTGRMSGKSRTAKPLNKSTKSTPKKPAKKGRKS